MRTFTILLIASLLSSTSCKKKNTGTQQQSQCYHSEATADEYTADTHQILLREIQRDSSNHPHFYLPEFKSTEIAEILNALQAVRDLNTPESKLIFDHYRIHTSLSISTHSILILVDTTALPVKNLVEGQPTADPVFDSILTSYDYDHTQTFSSYPDFAWIVLHFKDPFNFFALDNALIHLPYINEIEPNYGIGDGSEIEVVRKGDGFILEFSYGWGDCPAGCIHRHHWVFEVDADCKAKFVKEFGDALPH